MRYVTIILFFILVFIIACESPVDFNRDGSKLTGYVTHMDSVLYLTNGYYSVSVYSADSSIPFNRVPIRTDSLNLKKRDWLYETAYKMESIPAGRYYIASTWSKYPKVPNEIPIVLGIYGCDTNRNCTDYTLVTYPNYDGQFRNILSWTDPVKKLN